MHKVGHADDRAPPQSTAPVCVENTNAVAQSKVDIRPGSRATCASNLSFSPLDDIIYTAYYYLDWGNHCTPTERKANSPVKNAKEGKGEVARLSFWWKFEFSNVKKESGEKHVSQAAPQNTLAYLNAPQNEGGNSQPRRWICTASDTLYPTAVGWDPDHPRIWTGNFGITCLKVVGRCFPSLSFPLSY